MRTFNVMIERDSDGYYVASVPELKGCHTQVKSIDVLIERIKEAVELCIEVEKMPEVINEFIGIQNDKELSIKSSDGKNYSQAAFFSSEPIDIGYTDAGMLDSIIYTR